MKEQKFHDPHSESYKSHDPNDKSNHPDHHIHYPILHKLIPFLFLGVAVVLVISGITFSLNQSTNKNPNMNTEEEFLMPTITPAPIISTPSGVLCTMEAFECPDGSFVGREGPNCEFKECPPMR